jgi:hypothetical protein
VIAYIVPSLAIIAHLKLARVVVEGFAIKAAKG